MSDEFLRVATREILEDLTSVSKILAKCNSDSDVSQMAEDIEKKMHKIKGLAPMMGKKEVGDLASLFDDLLKKIISGVRVEDILLSLQESNERMLSLMNESKPDESTLYKKIRDKYSKYLE